MPCSVIGVSAQAPKACAGQGFSITKVGPERALAGQALPALRIQPPDVHPRGQCAQPACWFARRFGRLDRRRLEAERTLAHRHRAREVSVPHRHLGSGSLRRPARGAPLDGRVDGPLRLAAHHGRRQHHCAQAAERGGQRRHRLARTRRPIRALRRSADDRARTGRRDATAPRPGARRRRRRSASASSASAFLRTGRLRRHRGCRSSATAS